MRAIQRIPLFMALFLFAALAQAQSHSVSLSWTPAPEPQGIAIASWNVLRATVAGGPYTQISNVQVDTSTYTDDSVSSGQTYFYVVQAVDTSGDVSANSSEAQAVIPTSPPPLSISTTSLPPAIAGSSYSTTITASGGTAPYNWSGAGADGLTLSATGMLSGMPSQPGTFAQVVTVTDSASVTASASLTLVVVAPLAISTTNLPSATVGGTYSAKLAATGGTPPYTWSGSGVDGLTLSAAGLLSGAPAQPGTFIQNVAVRDSAGFTASATLSFSVTPALMISTTSLAPAAAQVSYNAILTAIGGIPPYIWSGTGTDGLAVNATGVLSGTPLQAGTFTQTVTVKDSTSATASTALSLTVAFAPVPVAPALALTNPVISFGNYLSWTPQQQPSGITVSSWNIFRSTDGETFTLIAGVPANTTTYGDMNLTLGQAYYYAVQTVSAGGATSPHSNAVEGQGLPPSAQWLVELILLEELFSSLK